MRPPPFNKKREKWDKDDLIWTLWYITKNPIEDIQNLSHRDLEIRIDLLGRMQKKYPPNKTTLIQNLANVSKKTGKNKVEYKKELGKLTLKKLRELMRKKDFPNGFMEPDSDLCKKLKETYDARMLLQEPIEMQKFLNELTTYISNNPPFPEDLNLTMTQVIYNLYNKEAPNAEYINGPFSLSEHSSKKYDKKIYLFGEYHGEKEQCDDSLPNLYDIENFLKDLFNSSPVFVDFFLEYRMFPTVYSAEENITSDQILYNIHKLVDNCMDPEGRVSKCPWPNVRTHFVDNRFYKKQATTQLGETILEIKVLFIKNQPIQKLSAKSKELLETLISFNNNFNKLSQYSYDLSLFVNKRKINRSDISMDVLEPIFKKNLKRRIEMICTGLNQNIQKLLSEKLNKGEKDILYRQLHCLNSSSMDLYLIQRVFKTFRDTGLNQPKNVKNVIIYVGKSHAVLIKGVLDDLGFKVDGETIESKKRRCLKMEGISQPFFYSGP